MSHYPQHTQRHRQHGEENGPCDLEAAEHGAIYVISISYFDFARRYATKRDSNSATIARSIVPFAGSNRSSKKDLMNAATSNARNIQHNLSNVLLILPPPAPKNLRSTSVSLADDASYSN
jgi:hypothetical protein